MTLHCEGWFLSVTGNISLSLVLGFEGMSADEFMDIIATSRQRQGTDV